MHSLKDLKELYKNKKIVFTNGCFDILHRGHVYYLNQARELGDCLVVGLNSDSSVKKLKGDSRPVNNEADRKYILENLMSVDHVVVFSEDTPIRLIEEISPSYLVKGSDYSINEVVGREVVESNGGEVVLIDFVEGHSTTKAIEKLKLT